MLICIRQPASGQPPAYPQPPVVAGGPSALSKGPGLTEGSLGGPFGLHELMMLLLQRPVVFLFARLVVDPQLLQLLLIAKVRHGLLVID